MVLTSVFLQCMVLTSVFLQCVVLTSVFLQCVLFTSVLFREEDLQVVDAPETYTQVCTTCTGEHNLNCECGRLGLGYTVNKCLNPPETS